MTQSLRIHQLRSSFSFFSILSIFLSRLCSASFQFFFQIKSSKITCVFCGTCNKFLDLTISSGTLLFFLEYESSRSKLQAMIRYRKKKVCDQGQKTSNGQIYEKRDTAKGNLIPAFILSYRNARRHISRKKIKKTAINDHNFA